MQAFYRRYRPQTFDEVYGQSHITDILKNQIKNGQIGHAYLFSGMRGTGKTTCAKILAKAINCLNPSDGSPCGECESCLRIQREQTFDIVEMDAASNRRIDDIRDLRDKVLYPPVDLKKKVYIIDEAHMITTEGFNALLKIMEEPPSHLVFILATTEIEKIPDTILSRCQRFSFRRIAFSEIVASLEKICALENRAYELGALEKIAKNSEGAMRDAHSLLDQVCSSLSEGEKVTESVVQKVLGLVYEDQIFSLSQALIDGDYKAALLVFNKALETKSAEKILDELGAHYRALIHEYLGVGDQTHYSTETRHTYQKQIVALTDRAERFLIEGLNLIVEAKSKLRYTDDAVLISEVLLNQLIEPVDLKQLEKRIVHLERHLHGVLEAEKKQVVKSCLNMISHQWSDRVTLLSEKQRPEVGRKSVRADERGQNVQHDEDAVLPKQSQIGMEIVARDTNGATGNKEDHSSTQNAPSESSFSLKKFQTWVSEMKSPKMKAWLSDVREVTSKNNEIMIQFNRKLVYDRFSNELSKSSYASENDHGDKSTLEYLNFKKELETRFGITRVKLDYVREEHADHTIIYEDHDFTREDNEEVLQNIIDQYVGDK